jgi:fructose-1,6-bisphosphatase/inositol monophosphatase family enzyme
MKMEDEDSRSEEGLNPQKLLVIILGASEWPNDNSLIGAESFLNSAVDFKKYLLDPSGYGLPPENLLDLFDAEVSPDRMFRDIAVFIENAQNFYSQNDSLRSTDLLIYYVGHGIFVGPKHNYALAIRSTQEVERQTSSLPFDALASVLRSRTKNLRKYLILDCCFAAKAHQSFQGGPLSVAVEQIRGEFPKSGTALLCSSGPREPSKAPAGLPHTMFSDELLAVLVNGHEHGPPAFSLEILADIIRNRLYRRFTDDAVRPEVHCPDQRTGDVAIVPIFPNPAVSRDRLTSRPSHLPVAGSSIDELVFLGIAAVKRTITGVLKSVRQNPRYAFTKTDIRVKGKRKSALRVDITAEDTIVQIISQKFGEAISIVGEEHGELESVHFDTQICAIVDAIDGTDLLELGIPLWCCAIVFFNSEKPEILVSVVGLPTGEIYVARCDDEGAFVARKATKAKSAKLQAQLEKVRGPSRKIEFADARVCFYGQKAKNRFCQGSRQPRQQ